MSSRSPLLPIFLIVLVDVLGFTIVIPLLAYYAEHFGASPLVAMTIVSSYAACALVATPVIGRLSDQFGRRPVLLLSQAGTCLGFIVLGIANSLWMVFLGRVLDGATAGNLTVAQAYISDHTRPDNRAKAFGVIGVAFGIGFMFGPALGGWLGRSYGLPVPFLAAACLSGLSILCTYLLLPSDATTPRSDATPDGPGGRRPGAFDFATYAAYFRRPVLRSMYAQFFLFTFSFSVFTSGFALFAARQYFVGGMPWGAREVGYLFAYSGLLGVILQGGLLGRLVKRFGERALSIAGFLAAVVAYPLMGISHDLGPLLVAATIASFATGVLRPVLTSRVTQAVGPHEQGVAIGICGSLSSIAMILAPPTGGILLNHHWLLGWALVPAIVCALGLVAAIRK